MMRGGRAARRRVSMVAAGLAGALSLAACDPCAGLADCRTESGVSYSGRIISYPDGRGVGGVAVLFRRTGGAALAGDSIVAITDSEGRFRLTASAAGGEIVGDVTVRPPAPAVAYGIPGVRLRTSGVRGSGSVLEPWTVQPYVAWVISLTLRRDGEPASWYNGFFRRTGGPRLAEGDSLRVYADKAGYLLVTATALDTGTVEGDLYVGGGGVPRLYRLAGLRLPVKVVDRVATLDRVMRIGSSFDYALELHYRGSWAPVAGADVEFRRTGGVATDGAPVTGRTTADGRVRLSPRPTKEEPGVLVGDVTVRAPGLRRPYVVRGVQLASFDSDELRFGGVYGVGHAAQVAGNVFFRGDRSAIAGAEVEFVRTGGLELSSPAARARTGSDGWFGLAVATDTVGEVAGDLVVRRPGSQAPVTFRGVRFRATDDDSVRFAGDFGVGAWLPYAGMLSLRSTGRPAEGWTVTFRRTGGIALVSDTISAQVLDWGGFPLSPRTREEGVVEGTLTARAPGGGPEFPVASVRLQTLDTDSVRLLGHWLVGPSARTAPAVVVPR